MAAEEVRSACFDLGKCNDGEGLDWLRITHRQTLQPTLAAPMHRLRMKVLMDETSRGYTVVRIYWSDMYNVNT
jgi:hypothetical protein